tara:strand:- start:1525 stop:2646 length:1122 start_codon:yes stop_codon:yes gene_type:complete
MKQPGRNTSSDVKASNPFIVYRERLDSYAKAMRNGWSDKQFVDLVNRLDQEICGIDGTGFSTTPVIDGTALAVALGLNVDLKVKVEINSVGGSHKARHLFGVALHLAVEEDDGTRPLAIASCGNAAIAAATVAKAIDRPIEVFVPAWAEESALAILQQLEAQVHVCELDANDPGDPCYARFMESMEKGAQPFGVQGTNTPSTFDGGRTLGWELRDQVDNLDMVFVQVGGGALGTATARALPDVTIYPVQVAGCAPLKRAWDLLAPEFDLESAQANPERFMWPWDQPASAASGLLDDVTYDWLPLLEATIESGGVPVVVSETTLIETHKIATSVTGLNVSPTGVAGLAGLAETSVEDGSVVGILFTGINRENEA